MMKKIMGIFVCILMICGSFVSAHHSTINSQSVNVENGALTVQIPVDGYRIEKVNQNHEVAMKGYGRLLIPGQPNLPSKIFSIAIPPGAIVRDVQFETKNGIVLPGVYQIEPCTLPRIIGSEDPLLYERDQQKYEQNYHSIYMNNNPYPVSIGEVMGTGGYRKYNLVDVRITPFVYYPLSGKLIYYQRHQCYCAIYDS